MDIRSCTALIIRKNGEYLVGCVLGTKVLKWSVSPYDAWQTRVREHAYRVARYVNGDIMLFNPVCGQMRKYTKR